MTGVAVESDRGCVRAENQDAWSSDEALGLVMVADGMGGGPAGALAAQTVVTRLPEFLRLGIPTRRPPSQRKARELLREAVLAVSGQIIETSKDDPKCKGMGATVVVAWRCGKCVHIAHQGDSRAYLFRGGELKRLTADHSIVALLVRTGEITKEEAQRHPARGQLTRFVGMQGDVYCDVQTFKIENGDRLLLCTDGLWDVVNHDEMVAALANQQEISGVCGELIGLAKQHGAPDNVTAIIWDFGGVK